MENNDGMLMWSMDVETAMEFYKRVAERGADTEKERTDILFELLEEGKISGLSATKRNKEQIIKDLKKNFNVATPEDFNDQISPS